MMMLEEEPAPSVACGPKEFRDGRGQDIGVESLEEFFARTPKLAVAFSGGSDSSYLLAAASRAGIDVKAYLVKTVFQPPFEIEDAVELARQLAVPFEIVEADVLALEDVCRNEPDRCYRCKTFVFSTVFAHASADGYGIVADGTNVSDKPERRPGFRALAELGVASPLRRAGMEKEDVRAAARDAGLFTADKPSFSCLAVHVPTGQAITEESLARAFVDSGARDIVAARAAEQGDEA